MAHGDVTPGRRIGDRQPHEANYKSMLAGDYCRIIRSDKTPTGMWAVCDPSGSVGLLRTNHAVIEHGDGTITVSPSILDPTGWHGWLEHGVWREA